MSNPSSVSYSPSVTGVHTLTAVAVGRVAGQTVQVTSSPVVVTVVDHPEALDPRIPGGAPQGTGDPAPASVPETVNFETPPGAENQFTTRVNSFYVNQAVNYALNHTSNNNTIPHHNWNPRYMASNGDWFPNDCTNFVSQALRAGDWLFVNKGQDDPHAWFYHIWPGPDGGTF